MKQRLKFSTLNVMSLLLFILAAVFSGGAAMAATVGELGGDTDPNEGTPLEGATLDSPEKGLDQQGNASTGSALEQEGITENHLDDYVSKFRAHKFALHTDILRLAKQIKVDTKTPTNWEVGEAVMELTTKGTFGAKVSGGYAADGQEEVELTRGTEIAVNDWKLLRKNATFMVGAPLGFDEGIADSTPLILMVVEKAGNSMTVRALNGPYKSQSERIMVVPEVPANTTLFPMAVALSESEIEVEPSNAMPLEDVCYTQKKVCAITYTELFERIKKKAKWNVQDIKDWVLEQFRRECTRSMLISAKSKFTKHNDRTGTENCYTEEGILRQLRLGYELTDGQLAPDDIIGIQAMLCGKYDTPNELTAYCGTKFVQRMLNMDMSKYKEYVIRQQTDETTKIKRTVFESNFGTLKFVHEYGLDDLGYSECAIIFSVEDAKHFYYQNGKMIVIDHEKGQGGEVREAKSQYYVKDDCVKIDNFNSMIVGPSTLVGGYRLSALDAIIKSVDALPGSATEGDIVYLSADTEENAIGLYRYNGTKWEAYNGKSIYVA